jgi:DNA-binding beta-propeller fold protein YncE
MYLSAFGSSGSGNGEFNDPGWTAVDPVTGTVYVTDSANDTVQAFSASGTYESTIGSMGTGNGQFMDPTGVAVDPLNGWVYVVDSGSAVAPRNSRVEIFTSTGVFIGQFGSTKLSVDAQGIAIDPTTRNVFVGDTGGQQIVEFDWDGNFTQDIGCASCTGVVGGGFMAGSPTGVAVDPSSGDIYASDPAQSQVQEFSSAGTPDTFTLGTATTVALTDPWGIAVDPTNGDIYVVDQANQEVDSYQSSGTFISQFGGIGTGTGQFTGPTGVAVAPSTGDVDVVDTGNARVEEFASADPTVAAPTCSPAPALNASLVTATTVTMICAGPIGGGVNPFYTITKQPAHGTLSGFNPYTGTVSYFPDPGYGGTDSFSFTATDDAGAGTPVSVAVTAGVAPPPLPTLSKISLTGAPGKKTARMALTATAAKGQPELKTIKILLPGGFGFRKKALARGLSVKSAHGAKLKFKVSLSGASLTIQLNSPAAVAVLKFATGTVVVSTNKAKAIKKAEGKHVTAKLSIALTNAKGTKTNFNELVSAS